MTRLTDRIPIVMPSPAPGDRRRPQSPDYDEARAAADALLNAFEWSETYEGRDFWNSVYLRLSQIANEEDHT